MDNIYFLFLTKSMHIQFFLCICICYRAWENIEFSPLSTFLIHIFTDKSDKSSSFKFELRQLMEVYPSTQICKAFSNKVLLICLLISLRTAKNVVTTFSHHRKKTHTVLGQRKYLKGGWKWALFLFPFPRGGGVNF